MQIRTKLIKRHVAAHPLSRHTPPSGTLSARTHCDAKADAGTHLLFPEITASAVIFFLRPEQTTLWMCTDILRIRRTCLHSLRKYKSMQPGSGQMPVPGVVRAADCSAICLGEPSIAGVPPLQNAPRSVLFDSPLSELLRMIGEFRPLRRATGAPPSTLLAFEKARSKLL